MDERISSPAEPLSLLSPSVPLEESPRVRWGILCYLAGDVTGDAEVIARNLRDLLAEGPSAEVALAIQYDGPRGVERYLLLPSAAPGVASALPVVESLGRLNSGSTQTFCEFLRWGLSVLNAERSALVIRSRAADPFVADAALTATPFAICYDEPADACLDSAELGRAVTKVLREYERDQLDLLAGDVPHMQFLELAYEFQGRVHVLLSAQTVVPGEGWDYRRLLSCWKEQAAQPTEALAQRLVPALVAAYPAPARQEGAPQSAISALDLRRLDDLSRVFDTLCVNTIQVLGEGLIWRARELLLMFFGDSRAEQRRHVSYDCGSFFVIYYVALEALQSRAAQRWLASALAQSASQGLTRFRQAMYRELSRSAPASERRTDLLQLLALQDARVVAQQAAALRKAIDDETTQTIAALQRGEFHPSQLAQDQALERSVVAAIRRMSGALSEERRVDFERLEESKRSARRLALHAVQAAELLLGAAAPGFMRDDAARELELRHARSRDAALPAARKAGAEVTAAWAQPVVPTEPSPGLVLALATTLPQPANAWPRWSGASLYRPPKLDDLMLSSYNGFHFHARVHWSALLGTANLIEEHPRALWRLVSSLLATGGPATRRDLMQRLTGADSVVWGLRDQFRAMAPAPMLTLSLERRRRAQLHGASTAREEYLLRLDSDAGGAIVDEQRSRVQAETIDSALQALDVLLTSELPPRDADAQLRSIGGLLGEDVLQALGARLEAEHSAALQHGCETVHLQLQIPGELMSYPWELLHQRGEWLSEKFAIGRQVFTSTGLARRVPRRREGRVRALVVGDPIFDASGVGQQWPQLPAARAEAHQVAGAFERLRNELGEVIDFDPARDALIGVRVDRASLRALLRDGGYDIVHFAGHGQFVPDDPEASAWLLSDGPLWALEIRNTLMDHPAPPWLVYASACEAARESKQRYQGNVFGLASAFINQGVAAYVAPLWPIEDLMAQQIALRFYHELLAERRSLGEALRRAKSVARRSQADLAQRSSLGWASLVLYGDPTEELFQALAGKDGQVEPASAGASPALVQPSAAPPSLPKLLSEPAPSAPLHAPDHLLLSWVGEPQQQRRPRAVSSAPPDAPALELVEEAGVLRFRVLKPTAAAAMRGSALQYEDLPGSALGRILADDRVRRRLPLRRGIARVIGRWLLSGFQGGLAGLVEQYDREQVAVEGLLEIAEAGLRPLPSLPERDPDERALLIVHGTFSRTAAPVAGFGPEFFGWARKHYRTVIGFDHWTLSKTPDENARMLLEQLRTRAPQLARPGRLDVIAHSRGGLVARAVGELLDGGDMIRNLVFLGTPNCGTDLANPKNWGAFANMLVNMTGVDHAELFGRLAGLLARLAVMGGEAHIPGLLAQNPLTAAVPHSFLARLQAAALKRARTRYAVVCASFEPSPLLPNLKGLWQAAVDAGLDAAVDALFSQSNDLVVNTAHAWCLDQAPSDRARLPAFLEPERVLLFVPPDHAENVPEGVVRELATGVHHTNLFGHPRTQQMIQHWLREAPGFVGA